jgi:hypothetical protein
LTKRKADPKRKTDARDVHPVVARTRARVAGLRTRRPADDPAVVDAKRELLAAKAQAYIERLLADTPPLSHEDRAHLSRLLTDPAAERPA